MKHGGFTLAEVLITLGIIGVVAAMTIPTLIANTNSQKFRSQYKKTISTLNQAARMSIAQYDVDFSAVKAMCGENPATDTAEKDATVCGIFNTTLAGATYIEDPFVDYEIDDNSETSILEEHEGSWLAYQMADGSMFAFLEEDRYCTKEDPCYGFIDVNGKTKPNKQVHGEVVSFNGIFVAPAYAIPELPGMHCMLFCPRGKMLDPVHCRCIDALFEPIIEDENDPYIVPNDPNHMTDIYPIYFYDHSVVPATRAGWYVLSTSK